MKAIVNATPLIALATIDRLLLLQEFFDQVIVPTAVYDEVVIKGAGKPGADAIAKLGWLIIMQPNAQLGVDPLLFGLDDGEMEVILLAQQENPDWVLIDERLGRRIAMSMGLPVKGTLGLLLAAVKAGLLSSEEALHDLQRLLDSGIRVAPRWQNWFRAEITKD